jgi:hypothetical protein
MASAFRPVANLWAGLALLVGVIFLIGCVALLWFWLRSDYARNLNFIIAQPVPFSHQHHVAGLGVDCRFCHSSVEISAEAGMPPTYTCMTCHSQIWTNATLLAPVRQSLTEDKPIAWNRVNDLPDYVYFNHGIHIAKGVGCANCHGDVAQMPLTDKAKSLTMEFCLDCHRDPASNLSPKDEIYDTHRRRASNASTPEALRAQYKVSNRNLTDCSICHR